jgi:hypothetical protein
MTEARELAAFAIDCANPPEARTLAADHEIELAERAARAVKILAIGGYIPACLAPLGDGWFAGRIIGSPKCDNALREG